MAYTRPLMLPQFVTRTVGWGVVYLLLVAEIFNFPQPPTEGLDPSWRMALSYFFEHGMQFGRDVIFNYGPLGFVMGKTFSGVHFWPLLVGQLILAVISGVVILRQGLLLKGILSRLVFFLFFFLFASLYEDAMHMLVLALLGFELIRGGTEPWRNRTAVILLIIAGYAQIKFTDLLFGAFAVFLAFGYSWLRGRKKEAAALALIYVAAYLGGWLLLGQNLANLPDFFAGSQQISEGWLWSMAIPAPWAALWKGIVVLLVVAAYAVVHLFLNPDKPRAWANSLLLGAFIYLNWKHGFVRADGHMIGFFFCALLPLVSYPTLLDDPDRFRLAHFRVFAVTTALAVIALESALDGTVRLSMGWMEGKIWDNVVKVIRWQETRQVYREQLSVARAGADLGESRKIVGDSTLDVLGCEQSVAIFNKFNYHPRPVIQGYSAFTPMLAHLNAHYLASPQAPDYILARIETIDNRLLTLDDAQILQLLPYRYEFLQTEKSFLLWHKIAGPFDAEKYEPKFIRDETIALNQPLKVADLAGKPLWAQVDVHTSLLGKIRGFLYQAPRVMLTITDTDNSSHDYLMPILQGQNGFILNPLISDTVDYMRYASGKATRWASAITVKVLDGDTKYFQSEVNVKLSALPPMPTTGEKYFPKDIDKMFSMFRTPPTAYEARMPFSATMIDNRQVAIMHAPSLMTFNLPKGAKSISGMFGYMPAAYTGDGKTNGARFIIYWSNGNQRKDLFQRFLNPVSVKEDHGLQSFSIDLAGLAGGSVYLEVNPGPYNDIGWDWTGWTDIYIAR
ncbi:MAG TPA: hypothetical protein VGM64_18315 [Lacunisphaera sp.]|jgi:hypothetical protein